MKEKRQRSRGSTAERGYGAAHQAKRRALAPLVAGGSMKCVRCGEFIEPDEPWDLQKTTLMTLDTIERTVKRSTCSQMQPSKGSKQRGLRCLGSPTSSSSGTMG